MSGLGASRGSRAGRGERGATLLVALTMLVLVSLLGLSAYRASSITARATGNLEARSEAADSAQNAIELTLSSGLFVADPAAVAATPIEIDVDANGVTDYVARLDPQPRCFRVRIIPQAQLDPDRPDDIPCYASAAPASSGVVFAGAPAAGGASLCAQTEWNIRSVVTDPASGAAAQINQGASVRASAIEAANFCL